MKLQGKAAVITGAGSGIGRATALKFAQEGAKVVVAEFNETTGTETVELIRAAGGEASFIQTNVAEYSEVERAVNFAVEQYGRIDTMFNNAGIGVNRPLLEQTPEDYDRVVKVNQYGVFYGILAAGKKMAELGIHGTIINTASVFAYMASRGVIGYHAAKGAVKMMTQSAALELAPHNIRVVAVAPGGVDTPIIQGYKDAGLSEHLARQQMRNKLMQPEQIANVVAFLASGEADGINGSVVMVDDGYAEFK
ncbi:SDR family NAD(P)-dependent oxidoreductase [Brevibacillus dissolubilis]|uniref:SDR family NAD(P)-dependent oxidoreductase n=1 Tax=Brevibacillus dissolubilis TaxID=1844116 RepID=UPI001116F23D|nr:SDR family oxidoreductase [Brevibacillus dissolubilis]